MSFLESRSPEPAPAAIPPLVSDPVAFAAPASVPPPRTLADLLPLVQSWHDWPAARRSMACSHVRTAGLIAANGQIRAGGRLDRLRRSDLALGTVPCDPKWLNAHLFRAGPTTFGLTPELFGNVVSSLRGVLRRLNLLDPPRAAAPPEGSEWRVLLDEIAHDEFCRLGLTGFAEWCHGRGVGPQQVTTATLQAFQAHVTARMLHDDIPGLMHTIARSWRVAARLVGAWPEGRLQPPPRRQPYTLPFDRFPKSFQEDLERFAARLAGCDRHGPFRADGPPVTRRPSTVRARLFQVRQAAAALVLSGRDPATITRLADLVEVSAFEAILLYYWKRAIAERVSRGEFASIDAAPTEAGITTQTEGIAVALTQVAELHCKLPPEELAELRNLAADVRRKQRGGITRKNLDRLRQFDEPAVRVRLLNLPERLMRRAEAAENPGTRAAQLALKAVAIEILLHIPLRIGNLARLRLGEHLKFDGSRRGRITHLALAAHETKNNIDVEWAVAPELAAFLERYLRRFRPVLAAEGTSWLFPAPPPKDAPLVVDTLRYHIVRAIRDEVGAESNPHLFRSLVARLTLEDSPGALEDVRHLLGDKSLVTVLAHYASMEPAQAARRQGERLRQARTHGGNLSTKRRGAGSRAKVAP